MLVVDLLASKAMHVLADIDNIPEKLNRQGLRGMIDRFAGLALPHASGSSDARLDVKLYGGWFERTTLTKDARKACRGDSAEIFGDSGFVRARCRRKGSRST
jgi:hypothetical protein